MFWCYSYTIIREPINLCLLKIEEQKVIDINPLYELTHMSHNQLHIP